MKQKILGLGVSENEQRHKFELRDEGEVGNILGIWAENIDKGIFHLTQTGLVDKVLQVSSMENYNKVKTPASTTHLGIDTEGEHFR